jgi:hypothetical protein
VTYCAPPAECVLNDNDGAWCKCPDGMMELMNGSCGDVDEIVKVDEIGKEDACIAADCAPPAECVWDDNDGAWCKCPDGMMAGMYGSCDDFYDIDKEAEAACKAAKCHSTASCVFYEVGSARCECLFANDGMPQRGEGQPCDGDQQFGLPVDFSPAKLDEIVKEDPCMAAGKECHPSATCAWDIQGESWCECPNGKVALMNESCGDVDELDMVDELVKEDACKAADCAPPAECVWNDNDGAWCECPDGMMELMNGSCGDVDELDMVDELAVKEDPCMAAGNECHPSATCAWDIRDGTWCECPNGKVALMNESCGDVDEIVKEEEQTYMEQAEAACKAAKCHPTAVCDWDEVGSAWCECSSANGLPGKEIGEGQSCDDKFPWIPYFKLAIP